MLRRQRRIQIRLASASADDAVATMRHGWDQAGFAAVLFALTGYGPGRLRAPVSGMDGKELISTLPPQVSGPQR